MNERNQEKKTTLMKKEFLEYFPKVMYHIADTCKKVGISRATFYNWQKEDEEFAKSINEAYEAQKDDLERYLMRSATGIPITDGKGRIVDWVLKPSVRAQQLKLQAKAAERGYKESLSITNDESDISAKSIEEIKIEMERLMSNIKTNSDD